MSCAIHQSLNRHVQRVGLVHLVDCPSPALPMQAHERTTVAALAQGDAGVLPVLLVVVGLAWAWRVAD